MKIIQTIAWVALGFQSSQAALTIQLPGQSESAIWSSLNNVKYPISGGWNGFGQNNALFPAALIPDAGASLGATFNKQSGGGYFSSSSIYNFGVPGVFHIQDLAPISSLSTVVFQADLGSAFSAIPHLNYNGGAQGLFPSNTTSSVGSFLSGFGGPPSPTTNYAWQWDLSALGATSYEIKFATIAHGTIYRLDLSAGDTFAAVIPEPTTLLLGIIGLIPLSLRRRV